MTLPCMPPRESSTPKVGSIQEEGGGLVQQLRIPPPTVLSPPGPGPVPPSVDRTGDIDWNASILYWYGMVDRCTQWSPGRRRP